jgi:hypothetical protein
MQLIGKLKMFDLTLPLNVATSEDYFRPPQGFEWIYHQTYVQHNNAAASAVYWYMYEYSTSKTIYINGATVATNGNVFLERASTRSFDFPLIGNHDLFPRVTWTPEAGKRIIIRSIILERPENFELLLEELKGYGAANKYRLPIASRE